MKTIGGSKVEPLGPGPGIPDWYWFRVEMSGGPRGLPLDLRDVVGFKEVPAPSLAPAKAVADPDEAFLV